MDLGPPELLLILAVVVIIFGVGKLPEVGGALGKSIREFRKASNDAEAKPEQVPPAPTPQLQVDIFCTGCGRSNPGDARFCAGCGAQLADAKNACPHCGALNPADNKYCSSCGSAFVQAPVA